MGEKIELMIDANYLFDFHHALRFCKMYEPDNISWFEEPVLQNDALLLANLRLQPNVVHGGSSAGCAKVAGMAC